MPSLNYTIDVQTSNGAKTLAHIIMLDTIKMCGNTEFPPFYKATDPGALGNQTFVDLESHLASIAATSIPYIIVIGHFPVWSIAEHGPNDCLVKKLRPLLHKYNVSTYINGHDHNLQHIRGTYLNRTVDYIVSGCAAYSDKSTANLNVTKANAGVLYNWSDDAGYLSSNGGMVVTQISPKEMRLSFYRTSPFNIFQPWKTDNGQKIHETVISPRNF